MALPLWPRRQPSQGRAVEQRRNRQRQVPARVNPRHQLRGLQRVPSEREEVVVAANRLEPQDITPQQRQRGLALQGLGLALQSRGVGRGFEGPVGVWFQR